MLGSLLFFGALGISGILCLKDNIESKRDTFHFDDKGNSVYSDRLGQTHINGERTYQDVKYDRYGNRHCYTIGTNSKKIYSDSFDRDMERAMEWDKHEKENSLNWGYAAYDKYDPRFQRRVTTEIGTEKIIACLYEGYSRDTMEKEYRKFYLKNPNPGIFDYNKTAIGDYGVVITKEEYDKLNVSGASFSHTPSDPQVLNKLLGVTCFR